MYASSMVCGDSMNIIVIQPLHIQQAINNSYTFMETNCEIVDQLLVQFLKESVLNLTISLMC